MREHPRNFMLYDYQKPIHLPIDAELCKHEDEADEDVDIDEMVATLLERRRHAFSKAKENIDEAQSK